METVVRFSGVVEAILSQLVEEGYFKTKSEAIRAGVLELGKEYHLLEELRSDLDHARKIDKQIKAGNMELIAESEIRKVIARKKRE